MATDQRYQQAVYYQDTSRVEPVAAYLAGLPPKVRAGLSLKIGRINELRDSDGPLPFPHSSQVRGELRELRCHHGSTLYRILYRRSHNLVILLHIVEKHSQKIPEEDVHIAEERWNDFQARMNPTPRPPRAVGHDAP